MSRLKLTSALGTLLVVLLVGGALVTLGSNVVGETESMAVVVLVVVVAVLLTIYGERFASGGTAYW